MSSRAWFIIIGVLLFVGVLAFELMPSAPEPVAPVEAQAQPRILVAKRDINFGAFVQSGMDLDWANWPQDSIQPSHLREGVAQSADLDGAVARRAIKAGEPITDGLIIKPGTGGFMSAVLEPGKRAMSIAVSPTSGNAGFIFPGDHVDLILTHHITVKQSGGDNIDSIVSETFIEDVRVIAIDQMLNNPDNKAILAKTVTVEVTPRQAEKVSVATDLGKISFSLRSLASLPKLEENNSEKAMGGPLLLEPVAAAQLSNYTSEQDISRVLDSHMGVNPKIRVIRGDQSEQVEFYGNSQ